MFTKKMHQTIKIVLYVLNQKKPKNKKKQTKKSKKKYKRQSTGI